MDLSNHARTWSALGPFAGRLPSRDELEEAAHAVRDCWPACLLGRDRREVLCHGVSLQQ